MASIWQREKRRQREAAEYEEDCNPTKCRNCGLPLDENWRQRPGPVTCEDCYESEQRRLDAEFLRELRLKTEAANAG